MSDLRTALEVCQAIYSREGELSPSLLVEEARPKDHPLHGRIFDRPPKAAAEAWYLYRADSIIKKIIRVIDTPTGRIEIREFSPVREGRPGVYDPVEVIAQDPVAFQVLLQMMEREWTSMKRRYDHLAEFWELVRKDAA